MCGWESLELRTEGVFGLGCVSVCVHVVSNMQVHLCACVCRGHCFCECGFDLSRRLRISSKLSLCKYKKYLCIFSGPPSRSGISLPSNGITVLGGVRSRSPLATPGGWARRQEMEELSERTTSACSMQDHDNHTTADPDNVTLR